MVLLYACPYMRKLFKKQIGIPQDHGSWVFILSPLLVGIFAGGNFTSATFNLCIAAMSAFMLRQPMTVLVKVISGRRPKTDLGAARFWLLIYGSITSLAILGLVLEGFGYILYLALPAIPVFVWHLWLVSKRDERKQANVEMIATGVLALAAPAAYWVGNNTYSPLGWWLWILCWIQSAASIMHVYLMLEQRDWKSIPTHWERFRSGRQVFLYTSFNLFVSILFGPVNKVLPPLIFIPFLIQWLESLWCIDHPAIGAKPLQIGMRQFIVSSLWTILFIILWR